MLFVLIILSGIACNSFTKPDFSQMNGTYVRQAQNEFGIENDTIIISVLNERTNEVKIIHRWKFTRNLSNPILEPEYREQSNAGIFDSKSGILTETNTMDHFSFDPDGALLFNGKNAYHKIQVK